MINTSKDIKAIANEMNKTNKEKPDPKCRVDGLTSFEQDRLHHIKSNINKAETLLSCSYFLIGENLLEARDILKNHDFKEWIGKNCSFKIRTAYNTMNAVLILREYPTLVNLDKSLLYYMGTRSFPKKLIKLISDHSVGDFQLSKVDLVALEASYLEGKITQDSTAVLYHLKNQKNLNINQRWYAEATSLLKKMKSENNNIKSMKKAQEVVVGENPVTLKCSNALEGLLTVAIKKIEELIKEMEKGISTTFLNVPIKNIAPLNFTDYRAQCEYLENKEIAKKLKQEKDEEQARLTEIYLKKRKKGYFEERKDENGNFVVSQPEPKNKEILPEDIVVERKRELGSESFKLPEMGK